jgi:acylpyruvate hydrolase
MKLVTFLGAMGERLGSWIDGKILDLNAAYCHHLELTGVSNPVQIADKNLPSDIIDFLTKSEALKAARVALECVSTFGTDTERGHRTIYQKDEVNLRAPVPHPPKIICVGLNYVDHCLENNVPIPESPLFFIKPWTAVTDPEAPVFIPKMAGVNNHVDYEIEMAIVMGRRGRHIPEESAYDYVAGYTILNDISARDFAPPEFVPMKGFDTFAPMGPCVTLKDDIGDINSLDLQLRVNGEVRQNSNTRNLVFKVPQLVSYLSQIVTLEPGDVISTGTPGGVGWKRTPPVWLRPGDVVEAEIQNIGVLRNTMMIEQ